LQYVEGLDSLAIARIVHLEKPKAIKHSGGVIAYFHNHLSLNLSQWKERSHDSYLWLHVSRGATINLFIYVLYITLVGSKHENESLFQNLVANIFEVQTLGGIVLLGRILMHVL
jgi:hypothetical protein